MLFYKHSQNFGVIQNEGGQGREMISLYKQIASFGLLLMRVAS